MTASQITEQHSELLNQYENNPEALKLLQEASRLALIIPFKNGARDTFISDYKALTAEAPDDLKPAAKQAAMLALDFVAASITEGINERSR